MGYFLRPYTLPGLSGSWSPTASGSLYTDWTAIGPIPVPEEDPHFAIAEVQLSSLIENREHWYDTWDHVLSMQLGTAEGAVGYSIPLGRIYHNVAGAADLEMSFDGPGTIGAELTKARLVLTSVRPVTGLPSVEASTSAGRMLVYCWMEDPSEIAVNVPASKTAQDDAVVSLALTGPATRMRYRVAQTAFGEMNWSGTPVGTKLRRYT